jgi:DNA-binding response OmpR family regulator
VLPSSPCFSQLAARPERVHAKQELPREVWGYRSEGRTRTVDAHACRLRRKLAKKGAPHLIGNVRGVGYRLSAGPVVAEREATAISLSRNGRAA